MKTKIITLTLLLVLIFSVVGYAEAGKNSFPITPVEGSYHWILPAGEPFPAAWFDVFSWGEEDGHFAKPIAAFKPHLGVNFPD